MNSIAFIILLIIAVDFLLGIISEVLNLRHLKKKLPEEFSDVFDDNKYAKSQDYTRVNTRFGWVTGTWSLILILSFWFLGGFEWLDQLIRAYGFGEVTNGLIFFGVIMLGITVLNLPFSIYSTFVIEERFGFNKTTPAVFITDLLKSLALGAVIGLPLLAGIIYVFMTLGEMAWLYGWIGVTVFSLILQYIAPTWIMPFFNKFTPLEEGELRDKIVEYSKKVDFPLKQLFVIDGSRRSAKANAFFTGFGKNKRIALYDTLIENHTTDELVAVVAHEVGHYKKKHIFKGTTLSILHTGIMFFLLGLILEYKPLYDAFYVSEPSVYLGLIFFGLLYKPVDFILSVFSGMLSRKHEFEADAWAAETTGNPKNMIKALKKLSADNLSNLTPHPFYVFLNYSHPPVLQRIEVLRKSF
jgi:STE24 endopeptidase